MKKIHFKVISATSQDSDFRATELNEHNLSTKGWISDRNCKYPQEIILELEQLTRIQKIQILSHHCFIASKVEFFVGASLSQFVLPHSNVQYKNIGYVELSDNERNDYQLRELKSVNLDAVGSILKLIIHENHVNRLNSQSQVGIIAINILGIEPVEEEIVRLQQDNNVARRNPSDERYPKSYNRVSSTDDAEVDAYQDPEVANIIQQLEERKQHCIQEEDFDEAKKAKTAISEINELGSSLVNCEAGKRKAAESEDFDLAATKKTEADEIRSKIQEILRESNLLDLIKSPLPPLNLSNANSPRRAESSYNMHPDLPKSKVNSPSPRNDSRFRLSPSRARSRISGFEDAMDPMSDVDDEQDDQIRKSREQLFVLMREAFGSPLARAVLSRKYDERLKGLHSVHQEMQQTEPPSDRAIPMLNACSALVKVTMQDVPNMFRAGLALLKFILTEFISRQKISRNESNNFLDRLFPVLLAKTEDPIQSLRNSAKNFILEMSEFKDVKPLHVVPRHCVVPLKSSESARLALSRTELNTTLYKIHKLNSGFTLENLMTFASGALEHTSGDVRKAAEGLIVAIYRDVGKPVRDRLPPDGKKIRRSIRYRQLFEALDGIDGEPHISYATDVPKSSYSTTLPVKLPKISRKLLSPSITQESDVSISEPTNSSLSRSKPILTKRPINTSTYRRVNRPKTSTTYAPLTLNTSTSKPLRPQVNSRTNPSAPRPSYKMDKLTSGPISKAAPRGIHLTKPVEDKFCIFCGESNASFTEEGLNLHYWKNCPMLTLCPNCSQIVEVSGLVTHQTKFCKGKTKLSYCPRCSEAIPFEKFHAHIDSAKCAPAEENRHRCPLCHRNFVQDSSAWKRHLMGNCKENVRFRSPAA